MSDARLAFLFPGQGAQHAGMLAALATQPAARAVFEASSRVLGCDALTFDTAAAQTDTHGTQVALFLAGVASARVLAGQGAAADFVAGHSIGAFAAAVHAGALALDDSLRLVDLRGRAMRDAWPHGYGMAAVAGLPEAMLEARLAQARAHGAVVFLANRNAARQFTVSGADADLDGVIDWARAHGAAKAVRLAVVTPSHSPLMDSVAQTLREAIAALSMHDARIPFATNRGARLVTRAGDVASDLADAVAAPVRWADIQQALYERGVRRVIEMAPGHVLGDLARAAFDDVRVTAYPELP